MIGEGNCLCVLKYTDGRIFMSEQVSAKDADEKAAQLLREHGSNDVTVFIAEILTAN